MLDAVFTLKARLPHALQSKHDVVPVVDRTNNIATTT